ncbi:MAG: hypothetical protein LC104_09040 [Bacteroidales bacterium]|nr:hypothetical protein [Bacteroidales bacterium]
MADENEDDVVITPEELAEAQAYWAEPGREFSGSQLFSRPAYGNGIMGDVAIGADDDDEDDEDDQEQE